jgi:site-specific recombinase XerD
MVDSSRIGLTESLRLYQEQHLTARNLAPKTRIEYTNDLVDLFSFLREKVFIGRPEQVEHKHLVRYLTVLVKRGLLNRTRRRKVASIRSFFGFLEEQGIVSKSPAHELIPPVRGVDRPRVLSESECERLTEAVRFNTRDAAIIELVLQTGIRLSECAGLTLNDISLPTNIKRDESDIGSVTVKGKGRKTRIVTLNWKACMTIKAYLAVRPPVEIATLFITKFGKGIGRRSIEYLVTKHLRNAGIYNASVHSLRHTFMSQMVKRGTKPQVIRNTLGYSSLKLTSIYIELTRESWIEGNRTTHSEDLCPR